MADDGISPEMRSAMERGLIIRESDTPKKTSRYTDSLDVPRKNTAKRRGVATAGSPSRRHSARTSCAYCGVTLKKSGDNNNDGRSWDHVLPFSVAGRLMIPACNWCNGKKAATSLSDWLASEALDLRRRTVAERDPNADPMQEKIILQIRDEDVARVRRDLDYHSK